MIKNTLNTKLSNFSVLRLLFFYAIGLEIGTIAELLNASRKTIGSLVLEIQNRLSSFVTVENTRIGGEGTVVQVDECCFGKRKYNVGRTGGHTWVFGGIDTAAQQFFMRVVPNRTKEVLGGIIEQWIKPGTLVHSDEHRSYLGFFRDNVDYGHQTVNHKENFVNPNTGAHTQGMENLWCLFKKFKRKKGYSKHRYLQLYLDEFLIRKRFDSKTRWKLFEILLNICF